jgi:hypothetical protein
MTGKGSQTVGRKVFVGPVRIRHFLPGIFSGFVAGFSDVDVVGVHRWDAAGDDAQRNGNNGCRPDEDVG